MSVFVARQPIFDRKKAVFGYELLFRSGYTNSYDSQDPDASTRDVISNSLFVIDFDDLTGGRWGFINFTRNLLTQEVGALLPRDRVAMEILEDVEPDETLLHACRKLKEQGYMLVLDDFVLADADNPLLGLADIVKVDFLQSDAEERSTISEKLRGRGLSVLAEKVETIEDFEQASECGYTYFQGYFFGKPVIRTGRSIAGSKLAYLRVMKEVFKPDLSYDELEDLIKQDVSLTYRLLRFMNSVWFAFRSEISSIKHALVLLGPKEIKKWFALVALRYTATDKPEELVLRSMIRAKVAEDLAPLAGMAKQGSDLFLMGMFSFIDALTDMSMKDALAWLPLSKQVEQALLGKPCRFLTVLDLVRAYEKGQWEDFSSHAASLDLDENEVPQIFNASFKWANDAFATIT